MEDERSANCRKAAFEWLQEQALRGDETFSRDAVGAWISV